jgi:hypothetical protein
MSKEIDEFVYRANPNEWLEVADELNESITVITNQSNAIYLKNDTWNGAPSKKLMSSRSIFLLMGFTIENLLKGILVFDKPDLVNKGELANEIRGHNLKTLAFKVRDLSLGDEKIDFLETLSDAIPDWGRYPCPLKFQQIKDEVKYSENMKKHYYELRKSLREKLITRLKEGWVSGLENKRTNVQIITFVEDN